jgi:hypothetical protein
MRQRGGAQLLAASPPRWQVLVHDGGMALVLFNPNSEVEMPPRSGTGFQPVSCGSPCGKNLPGD